MNIIKKASACTLGLILISSTLLNGCLGVLAAGAAVTGGAIIYDRRTTQAIVEDQNIVFRAEKEISIDSSLKGKTHVDVSAFNNIVLVTGRVPSEATHQKVLEIVKATPKIRRIYDQITIGKPKSLTQKTDDAWITTKVKSVMLATEGLHSTQIKVVTENGIVYLLGLVTHQQAELAADVAKDIYRVKRVVKLFEYES